MNIPSIEADNASNNWPERRYQSFVCLNRHFLSLPYYWPPVRALKASANPQSYTQQRIIHVVLPRYFPGRFIVW
jgi:hypothetical protein